MHNDLILYHASLTEGGLTDFLVGRPQRLMVVYHNITPTTWFDDLDPGFANSSAGRAASSCALVARAELVTADSEFNAQELRELGARDVHVVPPPIDTPRLHHAEDDRVVPYLARRAAADRAVRRSAAPDKAMNRSRRHHTLVTDELAAALLVLAGYGATPTPAPRSSATAANSVWTRCGTPARSAALGSQPSTAADVVVTASEHEGFCVRWSRRSRSASRWSHGPRRGSGRGGRRRAYAPGRVGTVGARGGGRARVERRGAPRPALSLAASPRRSARAERWVAGLLGGVLGRVGAT